MKKLQVLIMFFLIVGCVSTNKEITNVLFSKTDFCTTNEETAFNNSIIGCWGNHIETGNSILCYWCPIKNQMRYYKNVKH